MALRSYTLPVGSGPTRLSNVYATSYAQRVAADRPLGFWKLDDPSGSVATDSSGNQRHMLYVGTVQYQQPGPFAGSKAITLAGAGYAQLAAAAIAFPGAFSAEAWIKTTVDPTNIFPVICAKGNFNANGSGWSMFGNTPPGIRVFGQASAITVMDIATHVVGAPSYADGLWHHVVFTWDGTTSATGMKLYIDGVLVVQKAATSIYTDATALPFRIGIESDGTSYGWKGDLANVAVYDYALTPARILAHAGVYVGARAYAQQVLADGPYVYYRVNEPSGTVATDASGNGRTGTYVGPVGLAQPGLTADGDKCIQLNAATNVVVNGIQPIATVPGPTTFTIELLIKPTNVASFSFARFYSTGPPNYTIEFALNSGGQLAFYIAFTDATPGWVLVPVFVGVGEQAHIAYSWDGTAVRLYKNGVEVYTSTTVWAGRTLLDIGVARQINIGSSFNGDAVRGCFIDEVAYYNKALPGDRLLAHYRANIYGDVTGASVAAALADAYAQRILADSPTAYWRLNELTGTVAADSVGNDPGFISGDVTLNQPGPIAGRTGGAMVFGAATGRISANPIPALFGGTASQITIEAWARTDTLTMPGGFRMIFGTSNNVYVGISAGDGNRWVQSLFTGGLQRFNLGPVADIGGWHHVVVTYDGSFVRLYVDGREANKTAASGAVDSTLGAPIYIGNYASAGLESIGGADEVALYPTALTAQQVAAHYALGGAQYIDPAEDLAFRQLLLAPDPANTSAIVIGDAAVAPGVEGIVIPAAPAPARYPYLNIGPFESGPVKLSHIYVAGAAGQILRILGIPY